MDMDSWTILEKYKKIIKNETRLYDLKKQADFSSVLVYPNRYFVGMSNLGFQTVYRHINSHPRFTCERAFLPEPDEELYYKNGPKKLSSLEAYRPLSEFDIIAFSVSYEIDYLNVLKILHYAGIPLRGKDRDNSHPLIIAGGAAITLNPQPIADFADLFIIGEAENLINKLLDAYADSSGKEDLLKYLSTIESFYAPKYFDKNKKIKRNYVEKLDFGTNSVFLTKDTEFKNTFLIELTRGCPYNCSFCVVDNCFNPYRAVNIEIIKEQLLFAKKFTNRAGLISSSISNYQYLPELADIIEENDIKVSFSSMRADKIDLNILKILLRSDQKTLTIAPETASEKLKKIIDKNISEKNIFDYISLSLERGIKNFKLYFMTALPSENEEDIKEMINLIKHISVFLYNKNKTAKIKLSISKFIPKPFTPLQNEVFEDEKTHAFKTTLLKKSLKSLNNVEINFESPKNAFISETLSRADKDIGEALEKNFLTFKYANFVKDVKNIRFDFKRKINPRLIPPWNFLKIL